MKRSGKVYRDAAKLVEDGMETFSCLAINYGKWGSYHDDPDVTRYVDAMGMRSANALLDAFGKTADPRGARILALGFTAAMAETGDLSDEV